MHEVLFTIFGKEVYSFTVMLILGVCLLTIIFFFSLKKLEVPSKYFDRLFIIAAIAGIFTYFGASFFDSLWHSIGNAMVDGKFDSSKFNFSLNNGGITFEGGIFAAFLSFSLLLPIGAKKEGRHPHAYIDIAVPGILLAHFFGRIGCFLAGCCYGRHTDSFLGIHYPTAHGIDTVFPTQLYEAGFLLICFIVFTFFIRKRKTELYLITYGVFRFFLEYLRGDNRGKFIIPFLSPSQFMSIVFILMGIGFYFLRNYFVKKDIEDYHKAISKGKEPKKRIRYYNISLKHFFKYLFKPCKCESCQQNMKVGFVEKIVEVNEVELMKIDTPQYICKACSKLNE